MTASSLRRLAKDQATLRTATPPNYLFHLGDDCALPDDLTQLIILITGAQGTPYSQGVWQLHLKMPDDYPINPPKATFKTRIFHPNVDEITGAVCLETLKRDWLPKLTLKDILVTISCLLIHPNPDSALNAEAGALLQEDYDAFARKAKLMTSIHAPIPKALQEAVREARRRGEDEGAGSQIEKEQRPVASRAVSSSTSVIMKSRPAHDTSRPLSPLANAVDENEEQEDDTKENDPLRSPLLPPKSPTISRTVLGKRALSDIPMPVESNHADSESDLRLESLPETSTDTTSSEPVKKSPKLTRSGDHVSVEPHIHQDESSVVETANLPQSDSVVDDKENIVAAPSTKPLESRKTTEAPARPTLRKVSNLGSSRGKAVPRVGIRRL